VNTTLTPTQSRNLETAAWHGWNLVEILNMLNKCRRFLKGPRCFEIFEEFLKNQVSNPFG
jgi:hypothetical protein